MITYRLTPWDTRALGSKTAEIFFDVSIGNLTDEYHKLENDLKDQEVKFIYTRIDGQQFKLRQELQEQGFYFAESSLTVTRSKVQKFRKQKLPPLKYLTAQESDINTLKEIARNSFSFSRFHEDTKISEDLSRNRYFNWIDDLVEQQATIMVGKVGSNIVGFNIQKEDSEGRESDLILAGVKVGMEIYALSLWNEIMYHNQSLGVHKINTLISTSNIGVFNVYAHFDFKVRSTLFGFHKWI